MTASSCAHIEEPATPARRRPASRLDPLEQQWRVRVGETIYGPYSGRHMRRYIAEGRIVAQSLVKPVEGGRWRPAAMDALLSPLLNGQTFWQVSPERPSNEEPRLRDMRIDKPKGETSAPALGMPPLEATVEWDARPRQPMVRPDWTFPPRAEAPEKPQETAPEKTAAQPAQKKTPSLIGRLLRSVRRPAGKDAISGPDQTPVSAQPVTPEPVTLEPTASDEGTIVAEARTKPTAPKIRQPKARRRASPPPAPEKPAPQPPANENLENRPVEVAPAPGIVDFEPRRVERQRTNPKARPDRAQQDKQLSPAAAKRRRKAQNAAQLAPAEPLVTVAPESDPVPAQPLPPSALDGTVPLGRGVNEAENGTESLETLTVLALRELLNDPDLMAPLATPPAIDRQPRAGAEPTTLLILFNTRSGPAPRLEQALTQLGPAAAITESAWLVSGRLTASAVRNHLAPFLGRNDEVFIMDRQTGKTAWFNLPPEREARLRTVLQSGE